MPKPPKDQEPKIDQNIRNEREGTATDWLPDWRNPEEYPAPKHDNVSLVQRGWMWEFLRRNPHYQNDFFELTKNYEFIDMCSNSRLQGNTYVAGAFIFIKKDEAFAFDTTDDDASKQIDFIKAKYAITGLYDPALTFQDLIHEKSLPTAYLHLYPRQPSLKGKFSKDGKFGELPKTKFVDYEYPLIFNLSSPIKQQLETAEYLLKANLKANKNVIKQKRKQVNLYPEYLRVLDAKVPEPGIDNKDIASVIFPTEDNSYPDYTTSKKISAHYKAALKLRDEDYIYLPYLYDIK